MNSGRAGWFAAAAIGLIAAVGAIVFVGCGGLGVRVTDPIKVDPVKVAGPIELGEPLAIEPVRINESVPVAIQGAVPVALPGPITIKLEGPKVEYQGTYVSEALMERVQLGTTTGEWIIAVIGEPDAKAKMSDGSEIWKWVYRPAGSQMSLLVMPGQEKQPPSPQPITAFVRMKDGVVVDKWRG